MQYAWLHWPRWLVALLYLVLAGCQMAPLAPLTLEASNTPLPYPVRFVLTFDDGPSLREDFNPTLSILRDLADNPIQPSIKAIFFVQTRNPDAGGSARGRDILHRAHSQGHLLGLHSASERGHMRHTSFTKDALAQQLANGIKDIRTITGAAPALVRPPYWAFDDATLAAYQEFQLHMLLTDASANDGKTWGINISPRRRSHLRAELVRIREDIRRGALPVVEGVVPVVVTFHDTNTYTARHLREYLRILTEEAGKVDLPLAGKPFYDDRPQLLAAALQRSGSQASGARVPWPWSWLWGER